MNQEKKTTNSEYSVAHSSFSVERTYPASPARVFHAFADQETKRRWFAEGEGWEVFEYTQDFRVGGREFSRFRFGDGPEMTFDALYMDIVPDRRIVFAYSMTIGPKIISASLTTVELEAAGGGTRLIHTEHDAFLEGGDTSRSREAGTRELLDKLAETLSQDA
jgi:uncharacterized protein YndB with AHSA1/START domain